MPSLLDAITEEMSNLPEHEVVRIKALAEHIIRLCEAYGETGIASLSLVSAIYLEGVRDEQTRMASSDMV